MSRNYGTAQRQPKYPEKDGNSECPESCGTTTFRTKKFWTTPLKLSRNSFVRFWRSVVPIFKKCPEIQQKDSVLNKSMMMIAFITFKSSLVPLLEGL